MLSLWPQSPPNPAHQSVDSDPSLSNTPLLSLSAWYAMKIPEIIKAAPNLPASLYGVLTSMLNIVNPYPPLPNELIHHIFTLAATSDLESCRKLCLVSSWTRLLVLPHLIPTVVIMRYNHWLLGPTSSLNDQWVSPTLFTKHLWINDYKEGEAADLDFRVAFARCPNVTHLCVAGRDLPRIAQQRADELLSYTQTLHIKGFNPILGQRLSLYSRITDLSFSLYTEQLEHGLELTAFPAVSDLAIKIIDFEEREPLLALLSSLRQYRAPRDIALWFIYGGTRKTFGEEGLTLEELKLPNGQHHWINVCVSAIPPTKSGLHGRKH